MKLANKKGLFLNVANTLPRSGFGLMQSSSSQLQYQATNPTNTGSGAAPSQLSSPTSSCASLSTNCGSSLKFNVNTQQNRDRATRVINGIYLGNYASATELANLTKEKITHIVNCSPNDCPNLFEKDITYLNINIQDNWKTNLFLVIYIILDFLKHALANDGRVLIHCNQVCMILSIVSVLIQELYLIMPQGISRSPSIVIAYLIYTERIDASTALEKLKVKYPYADPNLDFEIQLNEMFKEVIEEAATLPPLSQHYDQQQQQQLQQSSLSPQSSSPPSQKLLSQQQQQQHQHFLQSNEIQQQTLSTTHPVEEVEQCSPSSELHHHVTVSTPDLPQQKLNYNSYRKTRRGLVSMYESAILEQTTTSFKSNQACFQSASSSSSQFSRSAFLQHSKPLMTQSLIEIDSSKLSQKQFMQQQPMQQLLSSSQQPRNHPFAIQFKQVHSPKNSLSPSNTQINGQEDDDDDDDDELFHDEYLMQPPPSIAAMLPPTFCSADDELLHAQHHRLNTNSNYNESNGMSAALLSQIYENHTIEEEDEIITSSFQPQQYMPPSSN